MGKVPSYCEDPDVRVAPVSLPEDPRCIVTRFIIDNHDFVRERSHLGQDTFDAIHHTGIILDCDDNRNFNHREPWAGSMEETLNLTRTFGAQMRASGPRRLLRTFYQDVWRRKAGETTRDGSGRDQNALPFIPPAARVLDIGCGDGGLLAKVPSPRLAVGVDIASAALRLAWGRGQIVVRADLEGPFLPFRAATFDRVVCLDVIEHLFDPRPLLAEIRRVLVSDGILILQTPNARHYLQIYRLSVRGLGPRTSGDREGIDGGHLHYFTALDVRQLLLAAGFEAIEILGTEGVRFLPAFRSLGILALAKKGA